MLKARYYKEEEDYDKLVEWWNAYNFHPPSKNLLSTIGITISKDNEDIVCGFLYLTNSDICWVEFIVSNPQIKEKGLRKEAINECINRLCEVAKEMGSIVAFTSLSNKSLEEKYTECGFKIGSTNCNEYIKIL